MFSDIEGAEAGIIFNDEAALKNCRQIIIEFHNTTYEGKKYTIKDLSDLLANKHGFKIIDAYREVFVFEKVNNT